MARSRNIKPGFFSNEFLAELDPLARLLFAGLWCIADREGRLEDRPKKIKAEILPYDDCDVDKLLDGLMSATKEQFIIRYEAEGKKYIQIMNFHKHQNPHKNETQSVIPEYSRNVPNEYSTSTVQVQDYNVSKPADSLNLIPDSLLLIPSSVNLDSGADAATEKSIRSQVLNYAEQSWGRPLSPRDIEIISLATNDLLRRSQETFELMHEAINRCGDNNVRTGKYLDSIIRRWIDQGLVTMENVKKNDEEFKQGKEGRTRETNRGSSRKHEETEPRKSKYHTPTFIDGVRQPL